MCLTPSSNKETSCTWVGWCRARRPGSGLALVFHYYAWYVHAVNVSTYVHTCGLRATARAHHAKPPTCPFTILSSFTSLPCPPVPCRDSETKGLKSGKAELCSIAMTSVHSQGSWPFSDEFHKMWYLTHMGPGRRTFPLISLVCGTRRKVQDWVRGNP